MLSLSVGSDGLCHSFFTLLGYIYYYYCCYYYRVGGRGEKIAKMCQKSSIIALLITISSNATYTYMGTCMHP